MVPKRSLVRIVVIFVHKIGYNVGMAGRVPLHGYNTNYRRDGEVYHVQTEDLGSQIAAIVTQVFTGGTILAKRRQEYRHLLEKADADDLVRNMMQKQHKAMLIGLRDGSLTATGEPGSPAALSGSPPAITPKSPVREAHDTVQMTLPPEFYEDLDSGEKSGEGLIEDFPPPDPVFASPPPQKRQRRGVITPLPQSARQQIPPAAATPRPKGPAKPPTPPQPAPGASLLRPRTNKQPPKTPRPRAASPRLFAEVSRPGQGLGEEQLGERSLDEVILSYLAEDLQED
jgi:hypothetical protein